MKNIGARRETEDVRRETGDKKQETISQTASGCRRGAGPRLGGVLRRPERHLLMDGVVHCGN